MPQLQEDSAFLSRYSKLNTTQREAVDSIYGPVMVIAGPGTGKTEVLSMRIAQLLRSEAQVQPHEILCLTYTDEATNAMRRRLVQIIGPAAHKVQIYTFHGFCNTVIQSAPDYFSKRSLQPVTDLERTEMLYDMLDNLPAGHPLRRLSGNVYYDVPRLNRLFDFMKKEAWTAQSISEAIDRHIAALPEDPAYIYQRNGKGFKKGDLKQAAIDEEIKRMDTTRAAAFLFDDYLARMKESGRYDFNDMILWVLNAFREEPALLQQYQERFQFILVDEFQDTNGAQSELLYTLTQFWEDPNLFVVGDDDQSIYEFQGARIRNIIEFYERFRDSVKIIVLKENYRSSQAILDKATATIANNLQRLIYQLSSLGLDKDIVAANERFTNAGDLPAPVVRNYPNPLQEEADIVLQIERLKMQGVPLHEVAVLYAQHRQADNLMALMERKGLPYCVKKPVNVLHLPLVQGIVNILRYLDEERRQSFSGEALLFEILHAPYYGIDPTDIAQLSIYISSQRGENRTYWRLALANRLLLESQNMQTAPALHRVGRCLDEWLMSAANLPLPLLLEKIVHESGIVAYMLHGREYIWDMQVLHTFFTFIRECHTRNPRLSLRDLLEMIDRMLDENISLPLEKVIQQDNGVRFYTAHGAKGAEFEHVFLIGCTTKFWEEKSGGNSEFKLPPSITASIESAESSARIEVSRRLFYVALTRAKRHLHISYPLQTEEGKDLTASLFVEEICKPEERIKHVVSAEDMVAHLRWAMEPVPDVRIELANQAWIERTLQGLTMSYTNLSKYLRCPLAFYYECILKVPFLKGDALAFGSAVHNALERYFKEMKAAGKVFPPKDELIRLFEQSLFFEGEGLTKMEYERRLEQGRSILSDYYDRNINHWSTAVEIEYKVPRYLLDGVPVTGKIDKLEFEGDTCVVIDYKTGDPDKGAKAQTSPPDDKQPAGGDYWRQMVFYKLLIENAPDMRWRVRIGMFDYVEPGRKSGEYKQVWVPVYEADEQVVRAQLRDAYSRIMNHEFSEGCGKPECHWCNFARKYELVRPAEEVFVEIDDV
jgi:DNA helicase-2/ATP-dependent DNA helicase PcrA